MDTISTVCGRKYNTHSENNDRQFVRCSDGVFTSGHTCKSPPLLVPPPPFLSQTDCLSIPLIVG